MILGWSSERPSKRWNEERFFEMKRSEDDLPPECCQVVLVGAADFPDEAVHSQALEYPRDLGPALVLENGAKPPAGQAADVELASEQGGEHSKVITMEEVEAAEGPFSFANGPGDLVQVLDAIGGIVEGGEKVEVAAVRGPHQFAQNGQAVDGLLDRSELERAGPVSLFHLSVVLEKANVVGHGLDPQDEAVFVIHLDGHLPHVVLDASALDACVEVAAQLVEVVAVELAAQKHSDLLGFDRVNRGADQSLVENP